MYNKFIVDTLGNNGSSDFYFYTEIVKKFEI